VSGRRRSEHGSITPLIIGLVLVVATLVAVVVDASAAYLRRQGLNSLSDAAALAATEGLQGEQVYTAGLGERAAIDPASAQRYVADYLRGSGALAEYPGLRYGVSARGTTVVVRLSTPLALPLHVPGIGLTTTVTGSAASVVVISE
jgi:hypothetical protein